jgi:hypothetical protein
LDQVTVEPALTVSVFGLNMKFLIAMFVGLTLCAPVGRASSSSQVATLARGKRIFPAFNFEFPLVIFSR